MPVADKPATAAEPVEASPDPPRFSSGLWVFAAVFAFGSGLLLLTAHSHRNDVAYITVGGDVCAEAADCERWVNFPIFDDDGQLISDGFTSRAIECRASERDLGLFCQRALTEVHRYGRLNPVAANQLTPWAAAAAVALTLAALGHTYHLDRSRRGAATGGDHGGAG